MKGAYGEDLASHTDPELCTVAREGDREALIGCYGNPLKCSHIVTSPRCDYLTSSTSLTRQVDCSGLYNLSITNQPLRGSV